MSSTPLQRQSVLPSLSSDRHDEPSGHNAPFVDRTAAIAAAEAVNKRNALANSAIDLNSDLPRPSGSTTSTTSTAPFQFRSYTTAPSPPVPAFGPRLDTPSALIRDPAEDSSPLTQSPVSLTYDDETALHLHQDLHPALPQIPHPVYGYSTPVKPVRRPALSLQHKSSQSLLPISRTPSLKTGSVYGVFSSGSAASSTVPSPVLSAMGDVTPLPSPLLASDSPGPWKQMGRRTSGEAAASHAASAQSESATSATHSTSTKKPYTGISSWPSPANDIGRHQDSRLAEPQIRHTRNRSTSEYIPDPISVPKRMSTVSGTRVKADMKNVVEGHMRREPHLSEARGLTPIEKPPTPPPSESSLSATDLSLTVSSGSSTGSKQSRPEYFEAYGRYDGKRRRWRAVRVLGQGTFSQVYLATSQTSSSQSDDEECSLRGRLHTPEPYGRRSLVAVKICEHGPRGGASEDRIEMSLKRELEIMKSIRHPSLVHLKAWSIEPTRAILVLGYYPGGDLFDVATRHRDALTPALIRRMFAELVGAITYLHDQKIVHRDIKLENVLVNLPASELSPKTTTDWTTYPYSVITLTDLGLSRRIADDEKLETRCGSDDYAAPEVIMGQPYDGRATDAWSLGVLLYALLEARLPFDPPPCGPAGLDHAMQIRMRSRTSHRIARVEWRWFEYGVGEGEEGEGDHEADLGKFEAKGLTGAMEVVEGLLKRARIRWSLPKVAETEWVSGGIRVEGGIKFREEEEGEEVL
ncbi:Serine/threonine-protein kinase PRR1 [Achaetomium macrosporum]|uniref:Serine/threonine-protein kinase PRR1 n=1 Tax=Achaetomium macrosporum TaxID=79813 RepID=A0AAN7CFJ3_9PEZI|nr:Serine/threonine-protein kinase PRR1 [Achaetomium macrosporum]